VTYYTYTIIKETLRQKYEKEEAARKYSDLLEADEAKSEFITIASHQLRTTPSRNLNGLSAKGILNQSVRQKRVLIKL
jgi:hypothetical protein